LKVGSLPIKEFLSYDFVFITKHTENQEVIFFGFYFKIADIIGKGAFVGGQIFNSHRVKHCL